MNVTVTFLREGRLRYVFRNSYVTTVTKSYGLAGEIVDCRQQTMRVIATVTIDGRNETLIEGESSFLGGRRGDRIEEKGVGLWLENWQYRGGKGKGARHKSRVFVPWTSVLFCEEVVRERETSP